MAYGGHCYWIYVVCDVTIWRHFHICKLSCTRLRILLNTICRKPGFNSLRTPLSHGAKQASNETLKKHNSVTDQMLVWYGGLLLALYNYNGLVAPRLNFYSFRFHFTCLFLLLFWVPCSSSVHRASDKKAAVPTYKVLVRPGRESNSRPTSTEADALTTRPRAGCEQYWLG